MSQYRRLLLILESVARPSSALSRASALAEASGAAIHIVTCGGPYSTVWLMDKAVQEHMHVDFMKGQEAHLKEVAEPLRAKGLQVTTEVLWTEDPVGELIRHVKELPADLVIKDTHHEPALKRAFMTPLDWQLLRECPVPVNLVTFAEQPLPRKVVAAVDLSQPESQIGGVNERILAAANDLALQSNAELHLLHAYENSPAYLTYAAGPVGWSKELQDELTGLLRANFNQFAEKHGVPEKRRHVVLGSPIRVISDFAGREHMDVVVMGTLNRKGLEKVLGSTTEQALYQVPSSILAVRPPTEG